jgi:osmotically-inducible protein OsmY
MRPFSLTLPAIIMTSAALTLAGGLPLLASSSDHRIETSARSSYNFKVYLKDDNIKVVSAGGAVTLTGTVSQEYHKSLAQETLNGLAGVRSVDNQLVVVGDQPTEHSDKWITMKVKTALTFHKNVSATETEVTTQNGVVTLTGTAGSEAKKELTGAYAMDVEGVTSAQIKTSLLFRKSTHSLSTRVRTRDGVVTLHGEARNLAEKDLATKVAEDIKGVKAVHNRMTLRLS